MSVLWWSAVGFAVLGLPRLVMAAVADVAVKNRRVDADVAWLQAIPADMDWPTDIDPEWVEK